MGMNPSSIPKSDLAASYGSGLRGQEEGLPGQDSLAEQKEVLRRRLRRWRSDLSDEQRLEWTKCIGQQAIRLARPHSAVGLYASVEGEVDTWQLYTALRALGIRCAFPRIDGNDGTLSFGWAATPAALSPGPFGILEPEVAAVALTELPLIFVPGLAFSLAGGRLGQGSGFYDRTFAAHPAVRLAALAFAGQRRAHLPCEPHDQPVDLILSEDGPVACSVSGWALLADEGLAAGVPSWYPRSTTPWQPDASKTL